MTYVGLILRALYPFLVLEPKEFPGMKLYAMKDVKTGSFGPVMMGQNDGHMSRTIGETFRGSNHTVERYPGDFELYEVGEMYEGTGEVSGSLRFVCNVSVILEPKVGA